MTFVSLPPNRQIVQLGERLRDSAEPADGDLKLLEGLLLIYDAALREMAERLRSVGLEPTTRLTTTGTIIEKLRRERHLTLRSIRDLAGARVVKRMTLDEQDAIATQVQALCPESRLIDRRTNPSHGYRAVHVGARIRDCPVEIQIRTIYQDGWAQLTESLGDDWGRAIRYGGEPDEPDTFDNEVGMTRRVAVKQWIEMADTLHDVAIVENDFARLKQERHSPEQAQQLAEMEKRLEEGVGPLKRGMAALSSLGLREGLP